MMVLHDGHGKFLEIEMIDKNGTSWEHDFFELGKNENNILDDDSFFDQLKEPYKKRWYNEGIIFFVDDVEYCLEQAYDCQNHEGDFADVYDQQETEVYATIYEFNDVVI